MQVQDSSHSAPFSGKQGVDRYQVSLQDAQVSTAEKMRQAPIHAQSKDAVSVGMVTNYGTNGG